MIMVVVSVVVMTAFEAMFMVMVGAIVGQVWGHRRRRSGRSENPIPVSSNPTSYQRIFSHHI